MNDTFMKEKPVLPLILSMSLPMVLSMLVNSLYNIVDSFFVAQISEEAMKMCIRDRGICYDEWRAGPLHSDFGYLSVSGWL